MYKSGMKQGHISKGSIMTVGDFEGHMVSLYLLMHLGEVPDEEEE